MLTHSNKKSKKQHSPRLAWVCTGAVVALQAVLLGTLALTTRWQPPQVRVIESSWAWLHSVAMAPMVMLLVGGPLLTAVALRVDKRKSLVLCAAWMLFGVTLVMVFGRETQDMLVSLWRQTTTLS